MLLYNEEEFISRCLDSIKNYAGEIIVGNNNCTDNTVNNVIAFCSQHDIDCKIIDISLEELYNHGFAWAKNKLIEQCEREYIYVLDGDEELVLPSNKALYFQNDCYAVTTKTFKNIGDDIINVDLFFLETHKRIFKKDKGIRYVGMIHEILVKNSLPLSATESNIVHQHYTQFKKTNKQRIRHLYSALLYKTYTNPELRTGIANYWFDVVVENNYEHIERENKIFLSQL
jgi:glycosyltransferase involved in cell wall biosynthesis